MYACAAYPRRSETTREKSYSAAGQHDVLRTRGAGIHKSIHCCGSCCSCRCTLGIVITNTSHDDCCKVASTHSCSFHLFPPSSPSPVAGVCSRRRACVPRVRILVYFSPVVSDLVCLHVRVHRRMFRSGQVVYSLRRLYDCVYREESSSVDQ